MAANFWLPAINLYNLKSHAFNQRGRRRVPKMKTKFRLSVFYIAVLVNAAVASQKTATTSIYCESFELASSNPEFVVGVGNETAYFSTFNGTAGAFLVSSAGYVSGECGRALDRREFSRVPT